MHEHTWQIEEAFNTFKTSGSTESNFFAYWNNFLSNMAPALPDFTRSFLDADWYLHFSFVNRAMVLCFAFDRIKYERWLPIYYEDCLELPKRFPKMYQSFLKGDFVVGHCSWKQCCFNGSGSEKNLKQASKIIWWYYWPYQKKRGRLRVELNEIESKASKLHENRLSHGWGWQL